SGPPHGAMYGHGFSTLFLGEVSGMVQEPLLRREVADKLRKAVRVILDGQNDNGGWRYTPGYIPREGGDPSADNSGTVCQMMALRSAHHAGVEVVPSGKWARAVDYVLSCQSPEGWFSYAPPRIEGHSEDRTRSRISRTAAGVAALNGAGYYRNSPDP